MAFIDQDFLLQTPTARRLFHEHAKDQPIFDYHNHLPPRDIASDRRFNNLTEIWLEGDHYKWRALRANGIAGAPGDGRRAAVRQIHGLGADGPSYAAKSALPLDAPGAAALLRNRNAAR